MDVNDTPSNPQPVDMPSKAELYSLLLAAKEKIGVTYARSLYAHLCEKAVEIPSDQVANMTGFLRVLRDRKWPSLSWEAPSNPQPVDDDLSLIEGQIDDLLQGIGASEDHQDVLSFLMGTGLNVFIANRVHRAIVNAETGERGAKFEPTTSVGILGRAQAIQEQRAKDYDQPGGERSMSTTVAAFNIMTRRDQKEWAPLSESEGWLLMQILKDVRDRSTPKPHRDSLEDCVSYSALKAEARLKE